MNFSKDAFINFTDLPDDEAMDLVNQWTERINQAEIELSDEYDTGERMLNLHKNAVWQEDDIEFFESFDATPIEFSVARPLINNLISKQRARRFEYEFVPLDIHSTDRKEQYVDTFVEKNIDLFNSIEEARDFYAKHADDKYAQMVSGLLTKLRDINGTKWKESDCFEGGAITGADFLKVDLDKYGRPVPVRRGLNRMIWDTNSIEYDLSDVEFIGDKVRWYESDIVKAFPDHAEQIREQFEFYTNKRHRNRFEPHQRWRNWWRFDDQDTMQLKVMDLYYRDVEERILITDTETGDEQYAPPEMTEDKVLDALAIKMFNDIQQEVEGTSDEELLLGDDARERVLAMVDQRFELNVDYLPVWFQMVFAFNSLFLHQRSPYPFDTHPYGPFFPQHNDGFFNGFLEDIEDIIVALNKALAIRELMMAHSAKGMLVVDQKVLDDSDLDVTDIADEYTRIGGMLVLKLKYNRSINDVMTQINTVGEGIPAINNIIADYDNRLFRVSGVNLAQLGVTQSETPASRFKMQIEQGETTNGLIFDNFVRALESFYKKKMVPSVVDYAKENPQAVSRLIGKEMGQFAQTNFDEQVDFALFESGIKSGEFSFTLRPKSEDHQANDQFEDRMMELAFGGAVPLEIALEFSSHPNRFDIIRRLKEFRREQMRDQLQNSVDIQRLQEILLNDPNMTAENADKIIKQARLQAERARQEQQNEQPQGRQFNGGNSLQRNANEPNRLQAIEDRTNREGELRTSQQQQVQQ